MAKTKFWLPYLIDIEGKPDFVTTVKVLCCGMLLVGTAASKTTQIIFVSFGFLTPYFNLNSLQLETVYFLLFTLVKSGLGEFLLFTYN